MNGKIASVLFAAALGGAMVVGLGARAEADPITITALGTVSGVAGATVTADGDLTNNTDGTIDFNGDTLDLDAALSASGFDDDLTLNALFGFGPDSIGAGETLTGVDLFTITLEGPAGVYTDNYFNVNGGYQSTDGGTGQFTVDITSQTVSTPEEGSLALLALGLMGLAGYDFLRRRSRPCA